MSKTIPQNELTETLKAAQQRISELERTLKRQEQRQPAPLEAGQAGTMEGMAKSSENVLPLFIEYAPAAIAMFDREMRYIAASRRYLVDYRLEYQEVSGRSHYDIFPEISERWKEIHRRCLAGAVEQAEADPFPRGDGTLDWVRWEIRPWYETDGAIGGIILFSEVITERKQAEERYRKLIDRLDLATRSARMGIWDWDIQKNELIWDDQMYALYGFGTGSFCGAYEAWLHGVHPEDRAASDEASARARRGEAEYDAEFRVIWPDGSVHWLKANGEVFRNEAGDPIRMIGVNYDISERKRVEDNLRQSEARYRLISENAADVIWVLDPRQGKFTYVSPSVQKLRGYTPEEVMAQPVEAALTPESGEQVRASLSANLPAFLAQGSGTLSFVTDIDQPHKDGSIVHTEVTTTYLFNQRGEVEIVGVSRDITARKLLETRLTESERRYNLLFQKSTTPVALVKLPEVMIADANEAAERLTGYTRQEMLGSTAAELGLISRDQRRETITQYERDNRLVENERRIITKSGEERIVIANTNPLELGGQSYAITSLQDITERKRAEQALWESERNYRELVQNANSAILRWQSDGEITFFNEYAQSFFGYRPQEIIGKHVGMLVPRTESTGGDLSKLVKEIVAHPELFINNVNENLRKDGSRVWMTWSNKPIYNEDGQLEEILAVGSDITELKNAEERFTKAFHSNPVGMNLIRLGDGVITDVNQACLSIYKMTREEMVGKTSVEAGLVMHREQRESFLKCLRETSRVPQQEIEFRRGNGQVGYAIICAEMINIENEPHALVSTNDITERKHMEDELRNSNAELEQFAYVASHDLQEPLRAVAGMVQLLQHRYHGRLDERADEYIAHAVDASNRMQALINDLLAFSRVDRRGRDFAAVEVEKCVQAALKNLEVAVQESGARVTWDNLPTVDADAMQLTQLFQNLLGNSLKFRGDEPPQIHIGAQDMGGTWQFSVRDNGIGIDPQYFERIFLVFQRLHTRREYPGTGIGLALCRKIVERHGGQIWVESQAGQGSTFHFSLPNRRERERNS